MPFLPQEKKFFDLYEAMAEKIIEAAVLLKKIETDYSQLPQIAEETKALEKEADSVVHQVMYSLEYEQIKVTEIMADIKNFVYSLDNVIDYIESAVFDLNAYQIEALPPVAKQFFSVIEETAQEIKKGVHCLRNLKKRGREIEEHAIKLNTLEERADDIHRRWRAEIMNSDLGDREVMKQREIIASLEEAMDGSEDVANFLEMFAIKGEV